MVRVRVRVRNGSATVYNNNILEWRTPGMVDPNQCRVCVSLAGANSPALFLVSL